MDDETQVTPMPRASGSARPRLVLGVALLILGLGDLVFMTIVLLPRVLAGETLSLSSPMVNSTPSPPPAGGGQEAAPTAPAPTGQPAAEPPIRPKAAPQVAQPSPTADEPPVPAPSDRDTPGFPPLLFYRNSAWLSPEAKKALSKLAVLLKADSTLRVKLDGHTDDFGPERFNQVLSMKRAERARAQLEDLGIARARVDIKAYGSEQPVDTARTPQACARNRRVEIKLN